MKEIRKSDALHPPLDPWRADALFAADRRMIGLEAIAGVLEVSPRTVRRWVDDPEISVPVRKVGGRYSAMRNDLCSWMRGAGVR